MPYFKVKEESGTKKLIDYSMPPVLDASEVGYDNGTVEDALDIKANYSNLATLEETTASKAYSVGQYLTRGGNLKKVTSAIASGEAITGNNTSNTDVGAELSKINSDLTDLMVYNIAVTSNTRMGSYSSIGGVLGIINTSLANNYVPYIVAEHNTTGYKTVMPFVDYNQAVNRVRFGNIQTETSGTFAIFENSAPSFIFRNIRTADENEQTVSDYTIKLYARE